MVGFDWYLVSHYWCLVSYYWTLAWYHCFSYQNCCLVQQCLSHYLTILTLLLKLFIWSHHIHTSNVSMKSTLDYLMSLELLKAAKNLHCAPLSAFSDPECLGLLDLIHKALCAARSFYARPQFISSHFYLPPKLHRVSSLLTGSDNFELINHTLLLWIQ